jgi:hypothetical protein
MKNYLNHFHFSESMAIGEPRLLGVAELFQRVLVVEGAISEDSKTYILRQLLTNGRPSEQELVAEDLDKLVQLAVDRNELGPFTGFSDIPKRNLRSLSANYLNREKGHLDRVLMSDALIYFSNQYDHLRAQRED